MQVRARRAPGVAGVRQQRTALDLLARLHRQLREVAVQALDLLAVVNDYRVAVLRLRSGEDHGARRRRVLRRATVCADVEARVGCLRLRPRLLARAEVGGYRSGRPAS